METHSQSIVGLNLASGICCSCQLIWTLLAKGWWIILGWKGVLGKRPSVFPQGPSLSGIFGGVPKIDIEIAQKIDAVHVSKHGCSWIILISMEDHPAGENLECFAKKNPRATCRVGKRMTTAFYSFDVILWSIQLSHTFVDRWKMTSSSWAWEWIS